MSGYDPRLFQVLFEVEDQHFWFRARNRALAAAVEGIVSSFGQGYRVLEIGCGDGNTLRMLEQACSSGSVVGMDLLVEGLEYARRRTRAPLVCASMDHPPFNIRFHLVGMFDVLEHLDDDRAALLRVRQLVEPGGVLLLTVPANRRLWSSFDEEAHHCRRYQLPDLNARLVEAGFRIEYMTLFMLALYPIARIGRRVSDWVRGARKRLGRPYGSAVADETRIRPGINGLLSAALSQEARFIRNRRHLPFGTSLLAVARVPE
jgi:SAM-dependent methyltransferase